MIITLKKFMSPRNEQQLFTYLFRFGLNFGYPNVGLAIFSRTSHGCSYGDSNMIKKTKNAIITMYHRGSMLKKHTSFDLELADANKVLYDLAH